MMTRKAHRRLLTLGLACWLLPLGLHAGPIQPKSVSGTKGLAVAPASQLAHPFQSPAIAQSLGLKTTLGTTLQSFDRIILKTGLSLSDLSQQSAIDQANTVRAAVAQYAENIIHQASQQKQSPEASAGRILALKELRQDIRDLAAIRDIFDRDSTLRPRLADAKRKTDRLLEAGVKDLVERTALRLETMDGIRWQGRTAIAQLNDENVLALKFSHDKGGEDLHREGCLMKKARSFGLNIPFPLSSPRGFYSWPFDGKSPAKEGLAGKKFLPYLLPKDLALGYLSYLGDALPSRLSRREKKRLVAYASRKAVDDLLVLKAHGYVHTSLSPLSHSEKRWDWRYWEQVVGRYGPSSIHNWRSALGFPNMRLSGLADWEHLEERDWTQDDAGQALAEWSLATALAGVRNGLSRRATVSIMSGDLLHVAEQTLAGKFSAPIDPDLLKKALRIFVGKFYRFYRLANILPQSWAGLINKCLNVHLPIPRGEALAMPGKAIQELVMNAIKPYVEAYSGEPVYPSSGEYNNSYYNDQLELMLIVIAMSTSALLYLAVGWIGLAPAAWAIIHWLAAKIKNKFLQIPPWIRPPQIRPSGR
ncbi:MAG TPA: hypothetical protein DEB40_00750 [Elusimicrobia bacterium]|nr:hypothetical protein [Elusimicrobiota bacterium]HBT60257.1 hypothetical protein [Elusimicrobiota bacterium]